MEFATKSGAKIVINMAEWQHAKQLKKVLEREISGLDFTNISLETDVTALVRMAIQVDSSDALDAALWPCLARCLRNNQKITESLFDDDKDARKDYYEITEGCIKENMRPFVEGLCSRLPPSLSGMVLKLFGA